MRIRYSTFWRLRKLAVETYNTVAQHTQALKDIQYSLDNHITTRLSDHEDKLKKMDEKLDVITKTLPPPPGEKT